MFRAFLIALASLLSAAAAGAQTYHLECAPHQPAGYPSFSAEVSGIVTFEEENVTGTVNMKLARNRVGHPAEVVELNEIAIQGSLEYVGEVAVINVKGTDTVPANVAEFIKLAVVPNGDKRTMPNGGFIRATHGYYRPHHCVLSR
jgi:hypothetical protein